MNLFGGNPAVVNTRTQGDTHALPMTLQITTSRLSAISKLGMGLLTAVVGFISMAVFAVLAGQSQQGLLIELAFRFGPILITALGVVVFVQGVNGFRYRRTVTVKDGQVSVVGKSLFKRENWSEPLSAFEGVRWREITVHVRVQMSGNTSARHRRPSVYQVLDLQHRDEKRCIPLHVTKMDVGSERIFQKMSEMIDLKEGSRSKLGGIADRIDSLQEGTRSKWENFAQLLDVPSIDAREGNQTIRAAADIDKSVKELAVEGKITAEWDDRPPPSGLEVAYEGDDDTPEEQTILVTIRSKKFPVWIYGAILAFCGFFFLLGVFDLSFIGILFGGLVGGGVIWHWRSEERNPRTVRITRSQLIIDTPNPGNATANDVIDHQSIESVIISARYDRYAIGAQLLISTDREEFKIASGVSKDGLGWLRDLILSAVAKA